MSNTVIRVENLGKRYRIGVPEKHSHSLRESLMSFAGAPFRHLRHSLRKPEAEEIIWALRHVSFEVKRGDVVGIIGRNGAGKSTLLKILTRITEPTEGEAKVRGRVGSLLAVGTGFHPELTGRQNTYLNGAILGMKKAEIDRKFDEIVTFSELERFIDTPVKRYSTGMFVRLAFAVAAHLEPEILLVDEVLAVGDAAFQKKCLNKMGDVSREGRTILFVSHNLEAIRRLCQRTMLVDNGHILLDGSSDTTIFTYLSRGREQRLGVVHYDSATAPGDNYVCLRSIRLVDHKGHTATIFKVNEGLSVEIEFTVFRSISNFHTYIRVLTEDGIIAFGTGDWDDDTVEMSRLLPGRYLARCVILGDLLNWGTYFLTVIGAVPDVRYVFVEENVLSWEISEIGGMGGGTSSRRPGIFRPKVKWSVFPFNSCEAKDKTEDIEPANQQVR